MNQQEGSIKFDTPREIPTIQESPLFALMHWFIESQDVSQASKATYFRQLKQFSTWLIKMGRVERLNAPQRQDILAYKGYLLSFAKSPYTVDGHLTSLRKFFSWLEEEKFCPNIARGIKGTKKTKGFRKDCLTPQQVRQALGSIARNTPEGLRDYTLFNLMVRTGLRTVEVAHSQVGDLRQEGGEAVLWVQGKGRETKDEFVLLVDETLKPLREYLSSRGEISEDAPLFASVSDRNRGEALTPKSIGRNVKRILQRVNLNHRRLSAHSFRHTAISLSIKGGASLEQAQAMARHTDPKITMIYFHNAARIEGGAERFIQF